MVAQMEKQSLQKKIFNLSTKTKIQVIIIFLVMLLIGVALLKTVNFGCEIKEYTLLDQTLNFDDKCKTLSCLFIEVEDINGVKSVEYFESDTKLLNETFGINVGDKMKMQWCEVDDGLRVRGISKA